MTVARHPLQWPVGWKRTQHIDRKEGRFSKKERVYRDGNSWQRTADITINVATERVASEMRAMGIHSDDWLVSSNLELRLDGLPRSNQRAPADPGIAVYWRDGGKDRVMAIDLYDTPESNLAAIAASLSALRAIERHGGAAILDRAFTGFDALPAPSAAPAPWWEVLQVPKDAPEAEVKRAYFNAAKTNHPDFGGSTDKMADVNRAWAEYRKAA